MQTRNTFEVHGAQLQHPELSKRSDSGGDVAAQFVSTKTQTFKRRGERLKHAQHVGQRRACTAKSNARILDI